MTKITIAKHEYEKMQRQIAKLNALEAGGVDNWEWYGESLKGWHKDGAVEEAIDFAIEEINEVLIGAEVEYPAGREAGHSIHYDDDAMRAAMKKFIAAYNEATEGDDE